MERIISLPQRNAGFSVSRTKGQGPSARELVAAHLARVGQTNPFVNAIVTSTAEP
jgi:hypothetical protein